MGLLIAYVAAGLVGQAIGTVISGWLQDPHRRHHKLLRRMLADQPATNSITCGTCGDTERGKGR